MQPRSGRVVFKIGEAFPRGEPLVILRTTAKTDPDVQAHATSAVNF